MKLLLEPRGSEFGAEVALDSRGSDSSWRLPQCPVFGKILRVEHKKFVWFLVPTHFGREAM